MQDYNDGRVINRESGTAGDQGACVVSVRDGDLLITRGERIDFSVGPVAVTSGTDVAASGPRAWQAILTWHGFN